MDVTPPPLPDPPEQHVEGRIGIPGRSRFVPRRVIALATRQYGVVSRQQLLDLGMPAGTIRAWLRQGRLVVIHPGVYSVGHGAVSPRGRLMAAVLAGDEGAALSLAAAGSLRGLRRSNAARIDVAVRRGGERELDGIRFHRPRIFDPQDVTLVDGIPCTTVARTLVDLAGVLSYADLERTVEQAVRLDVLDFAAIAEVLERVARPRGVKNLRKILGSGLAGAKTRSGVEKRFLRRLSSAGIARPLVNERLEVGPGEWLEVDFHWPRSRFVVETDSEGFHATESARRRDYARDRKLRDAGWRVERLAEADVDAPSAELIEFLRVTITSRDDPGSLGDPESSLDAPAG